MLVLKSIWKVLSQILFTLLLCVAGLIGFFILVALLSWVCGLIGSGITALFGEAAVTAFCEFMSGAIIYILAGLAVIGIVVLFILEVREQYLIEKGKKERLEG